MVDIISRIDALKRRGFSEGIIKLFECLDENTSRLIYEDLMTLSAPQVHRCNHYERMLRGSEK